MVFIVPSFIFGFHLIFKQQWKSDKKLQHFQEYFYCFHGGFVRWLWAAKFRRFPWKPILIFPSSIIKSTSLLNTPNEHHNKEFQIRSNFFWQWRPSVWSAFSFISFCTRYFCAQTSSIICYTVSSILLGMTDILILFYSWFSLDWILR
jgi:hypothetical protein